MNRLRDGVTVQMATGQYFENHHVQRAGHKVAFRFLGSHR